MIVSGVVVKVTPGSEAECARHLSRSPGTRVEAVEPGNLALVMEAQDSRALLETTRRWQEEVSGIQGVYPTFIGRHESESPE